VFRVFPLFTRCEWFVVNRNVIKRVPLYNDRAIVRPVVHGPRNWSNILDGERINQSHLNNSVTLSMQLVNPLSVQDLGPISSIVNNGPKARIRLEIRMEIGLDFDQSKQSSLNLRLVFFPLSNWLNSNPISISISSLIRV